jgi:hypothetical protein
MRFSLLGDYYNYIGVACLPLCSYIIRSRACTSPEKYSHRLQASLDFGVPYRRTVGKKHRS